MNRDDLLKKLDGILELPPGTLTGTETLRALAGWDSLAVMSFISMVDEELGLSIPAQEIIQSVTVNDLVTICLVGVQV
jgi:acyl carrier protein